MKKSGLIIIGVFLSCNAFAQNIEGVKIGTSFSSSTNVKEIDESKVIQVFGTPDEIRRGVGEDGDNCCDFNYHTPNGGASDYLSFSDGILVGFDLHSSRFLAATDMFTGGIRVGDSLRKVTNVAVYWENYQQPSNTNQKTLIYSRGSYTARGQQFTFLRVYFDETDSFITIGYSGDIITHIESDIF